jgi:uncharacterized membrane protein
MDIPLDSQKPVLSLDAIAKATALIAVVTYACGFLVVTLHLSAFGFVEVNPLKPRILTAGAFFIAAIVMPTLMAYVLIRVEGINDSKTTTAAWLVPVLFYYVACQLVGNLVLLMLSDTKDYDELLVFVFFMAPWLIGARKIATKVPPGLLIVTSIAGIIFLLVRSGILIHRNRWDAAVELWFFLIGLEGRFNIYLLKKPEERVKFPLIVLVLLPLLYAFATVFYPRINSAWGGGRPIPVVLSFSKDSRFLPSGEREVQLIDESELGLYVMTKEDKQVIFIPRGSVALMRFSDQGLLPDLWSTDPESKPSR